MKFIFFLLVITFAFSSFCQANSSSELRKMESISSKLEQLKRNLKEMKMEGQSTSKSAPYQPLSRNKPSNSSFVRPTGSSKLLSSPRQSIIPETQPEDKSTQKESNANISKIQDEKKSIESLLSRSSENSSIVPNRFSGEKQITPKSQSDAMATQTETDAVISRIRKEMRSIEGLLSRASEKSVDLDISKSGNQAFSSSQPPVAITKNKAQLEYDALSTNKTSSGNNLSKNRKSSSENEYASSRQKYSDRDYYKSYYKNSNNSGDIRIESGKKNLKSAE